MNTRVATPDIMTANCGLRPMRTGKTKVAPNMATTCWAPSPMVRPHPSLSSGATTSPGSSTPRLCSFQIMRVLPGLAPFRSLSVSVGRTCPPRPPTELRSRSGTTFLPAMPFGS